MQTIQQVASLRAKLWDAGFRPVPVYNFNAPGPSPGKRPMGEAWQHSARLDPPIAVVEDPRPEALNTGVLCDGLRAVDIDIDNLTLAHRCREIALAMLGHAPFRIRRNSARCLIVYRAVEGMPRKASIVGSSGKIEVLGHGQQFVAFGRHPEGAELEWQPEALGDELSTSLPAVSEDQIAAYLTACGPIIGAKPLKTNGHDHSHSPGVAEADPLRIAAALADIPNFGPADWTQWNRVGMAVWRATGGGSIGWEAFDAWSARNQNYNATLTRERWYSYATSPPNEIGAGTIFHLAQEARVGDPFHEPALDAPPPDPTDAGYWKALQQQAAMSAAEWDALAQRETGRSIPSTPEARERAGTALWAITEPWDVTTIPTRPWIAGGYLMRRSLTVLSGAGSAGKSSLMVAWAGALALGCAFHRMRPGGVPLRVATYNVEDDADEQKRRFSALLDRMNLAPNALSGNLAILGPNQVGTLLHTARDGGLLVNTPVMDRLEAFITEFNPDVLILDPFVEMHAAEENDNTAVRAVLARLRTMAIEHNMALIILHHSRKGAGDPGDPESLRGASSIIGAARIVLTVNVMTKEEAQSFGISPERRRNFFRLDGAKNNYAPIEDAEWFERVEIRLNNGGDHAGDGVAVAWPWHPPSVWAKIPPADINKLMDEIAAGPAPGQYYSPTAAGAQNDRPVFPLVIKTLEVNETQAKAMVKTWLKSGLLKTFAYKNSHCKNAKGLSVDDMHRPTE
jgi:AAA domain-containing protein/primase-like protein/bifunctional DNA primase/polymerase-like protein